jgi:hypothetical protein
MARQAQNPEISLILNMLILLLCIGAFQVKAQVGGLPNDEGKLSSTSSTVTSFLYMH